MKNILMRLVADETGSPTMETLIVMAVLGGVAVVILGGLATTLKSKNTDLINGINTNVDPSGA